MDNFEKFLNWLDPDRDMAGIKYEGIQCKLTRFFVIRAGGVEAEALADDTIQRVIDKIGEIVPGYEGDPLRYFFGVARNVFREWLRKELIKREYPPPPPTDSDEQTEERERLDRCLQNCLKKTDQGDQELILEYYTGVKKEKIVNRMKLAEKRRMAPNALRIKAHRIRARLRGCVEECLEGDDKQTKGDETDLRNSH